MSDKMTLIDRMTEEWLEIDGLTKVIQGLNDTSGFGTSADECWLKKKQFFNKQVIKQFYNIFLDLRFWTFIWTLIDCNWPWMTLIELKSAFDMAVW